jgi:hypothetical protein
VGRSTRLLALLQALRGRRHPVTAAALAQEPEVSERTIYRYWGANATSAACGADLIFPAMGEDRGSHVVHGLRRKRAQIAGFVANHEKKARYWREALAHVDATLKLFSPELDPEQIPATRPHRKSRYFSGSELARLCLDELRKADGEARSAGDLLDAAVVAGNIPDQPHIRVALKERIINYLNTKEKDGEVVHVGLTHNAH